MQPWRRWSGRRRSPLLCRPFPASARREVTPELRGGAPPGKARAAVATRYPPQSGCAGLSAGLSAGTSPAQTPATLLRLEAAERLRAAAVVAQISAEQQDSPRLQRQRLDLASRTSRGGRPCVAVVLRLRARHRRRATSRQPPARAPARIVKMRVMTNLPFFPCSRGASCPHATAGAMLPAPRWVIHRSLCARPERRGHAADGPNAQLQGQRLSCAALSTSALALIHGIMPRRRWPTSSIG